MDLIRVFGLHNQIETLFSGLDSGLTILSKICGTLNNPNSSDALKTLCLKIICNFCMHLVSRYALIKNCAIIFDAMKNLLDNWPNNNNVKNAFASTVLNISILFNETSKFEIDSVNQFGLIIQRCFEFEKSNQNLLKFLISIGNIALMTKEINNSFKFDSNLRNILQKLNFSSEDNDYDKVIDCRAEVLNVI